LKLLKATKLVISNQNVKSKNACI